MDPVLQAFLVSWGWRADVILVLALLAAAYIIGWWHLHRAGHGPDPGSRIAIDYGVYGIPELFFIDRQGRITYKHIGLIAGATLQAKLEEALQGNVTSREGRGQGYQSAR